MRVKSSVNSGTHRTTTGGGGVQRSDRKSSSLFKNQDGNMMSVRAVESYNKHMERQNARLDRKFEAEDRDNRRPGSGMLW